MGETHFKFSRKPVVSAGVGLKEGVLPLVGLILITGILVAVLALLLHFGKEMAPVVPVHSDDGETVDPNPLRFVFMLVGFIISFILAYFANKLGRREKVLPSFFLGFAAGTMLWQAVGECAWHFSIVGENYLSCFPHIEGPSAVFMVIICTIVIVYCWKRNAFDWGIWAFVLSFIGNWFGHFVMIGTYPLAASIMEEEAWFRLSGWALGLATVAVALVLNFFSARTRKARLCCSMMLYFGIGIIVTGVAGI